MATWAPEYDKALKKFLEIIEAWNKNPTLMSSENSKKNYLTKGQCFVGGDSPPSFKHKEKYKFEWRRGPLYSETFTWNDESIEVVICKYNTRAEKLLNGTKNSVKLWRFQTIILGQSECAEACIYWCQKSNIKIN